MPDLHNQMGDRLIYGGLTLMGLSGAGLAIVFWLGSSRKLSSWAIPEISPRTICTSCRHAVLSCWLAGSASDRLCRRSSIEADP